MKKFALFFASAAILTAAFMSVGCSDSSSDSDSPHEHAFAEAWKNDDSEHWHQCSCGEKKDSADHSWNDGEVTTPATTTEEGVRTFTCTVCAATKTEKIDKIGEDHTHSYATARYNTEKHWKECSCGAKSEEAEHSDFAEVAEKSTASTCTVPGKKVEKCGGCDYEKETGLPLAAHTENTDYEIGTDKHWKNCSVCGGKIDTTEAPHNYDNATNSNVCSVCEYDKSCQHTNTTEEVIAPTCTEGGKTIVKCTDCNTVLDDNKNPQSALGHEEPTEYTQGETSHWKVCTVCNQKIDSTEVNHTAKADYEKDESQHWQVCACGEVMGEREDHKDDDNNNTCDTCGAEMPEVND